MLLTGACHPVAGHTRRGLGAMNTLHLLLTVDVFSQSCIFCFVNVAIIYDIFEKEVAMLITFIIHMGGVFMSAWRAYRLPRIW